MRADRPGRAARRPAVAAAGQRALHPGRARLPERQVRPGRPLPGRRAQAVPGEVGRRATGSCAAGCRARPAPGALYPIGRARGASPTSRRCTSRAPAWASTGAPSATRSACVGPHAVETVGVVDLAEKFPEAVPAGRRPGRVPAAGVQPDRQRVRRAAPDVIAQEEADGLLGQPHRGVLEGGHPQGQLQPGRAAARPQRVRARSPVRCTGDVVVGETAAPPARGTPQPGRPVTPAPRRPRPRPPQRTADERTRRRLRSAPPDRDRRPSRTAAAGRPGGARCRQRRPAPEPTY